MKIEIDLRPKAKSELQFCWYPIIEYHRGAWFAIYWLTYVKYVRAKYHDKERYINIPLVDLNINQTMFVLFVHIALVILLITVCIIYGL